MQTSVFNSHIGEKILECTECEFFFTKSFVHLRSMGRAVLQVLGQASSKHTEALFASKGRGEQMNSHFWCQGGALAVTQRLPWPRHHVKWVAHT